MTQREGFILLLLAFGVSGRWESGVQSTHVPITAWATFSTHDLELVATQHQNDTIFLVIRGALSDCINLNFTYDPPNPTIVPLANLIVCPPEQSITSTSTSTSASTSTSTSTSTSSSTSTATSTSTTSSTSVEPATSHTTGASDTMRGLPSADSYPAYSLAATFISPPLLHPLAVPASSAPLLWNGSVEVVSRWVGKTILGVTTEHQNVDVVEAFVRVSVIHTPALDTVSDVFGWVYTIVWDISFLPQIYLNWRRKSVEGFSLDNVTLNIIAYLFYTLYNIAFFTIPLIKAQFQERYPRMVNHVRPNDVFFASFSFVVEVILGLQCIVYQRAPGQIVSWPCRLLFLGSIVAVLVSCVLAAVHKVWWLDVFYLMSYLKLGITPLKYIPQVYVNYKRKSTEGFSITGVIMDFSGGVLSLAQMFLLSANNDDWLSIFTNFSKFGLGVVTLLFDTNFFLQHYYYHIRDNSSIGAVSCKKNKTKYRKIDYQTIEDQ